MGGGLAFLSKKSFNPSNIANQKNVWKAEQSTNREKARMKERERQLRIERDHEELARARDGANGGERAKLRFMYDAPPGLDGNKESKDTFQYENSNGFSKDSDSDILSFGRQAGDDDAAAEFRRMLGGMVTQSSKQEEDSSSNLETAVTSSLIVSGSTAEVSQGDKSALTQLERAVGRKSSGSAMTYEEQVARFPSLKNAPMALKRKGDEDAGVESNVHFKPLGAQIRNVRCLKCGIWGHSRGDRECKLSGWDPFSFASTQQNENDKICQPSVSEDKAGKSNDDTHSDRSQRKSRKKEKRKRKHRHSDDPKRARRKDKRRKDRRRDSSEDSNSGRHRREKRRTSNKY